MQHMQAAVRHPRSSQEAGTDRSLRILRMEQSGSLLTLTVRGERSEVLRLAQAQNPVFAEVLPSDP